jgi:fibronectin-binding autotransporter adhesin
MGDIDALSLNYYNIIAFGYLSSVCNDYFMIWNLFCGSSIMNSSKWLGLGTVHIGIIRLGLLGFTAAGALFLNLPFANATDRYWAVSAGNWSTAANWGGTEPTDFDNAYVRNGGTATITKTGEVCTNLYLGAPVIGRVEMTGGDLNVASDAFVGYSGAGIFTQSAGTTQIVGDGPEYEPHGLFLGYNANASGTYNLSGTGSLYIGSPYRGEIIGFEGTGTFNQSGGLNSTYVINIGYQSSSNGTYTLSELGQLSAEVEIVGGSGAGIFNQNGGNNILVEGGEFGSLGLVIGSDSSGNGTYNLTGGTLILKSISKGAGAATFNFGGGTIQANGRFTTTLPMTLSGNGGDANVNTAGYAVAFSGVLSGTGGLNKLGSNTLTLNALNSYSGNTTVNSGTLEIAGGIASGGTSLIDVQSGNLIFKAVNISKPDLDITTAALTTYEILNGTHEVGDIDGSGLTRVDNGATLTAASIHQGKLRIGSGAKVVIGPLVGGLQAGSLTPVPEPSAIVLLAGVFILSCFITRLRIHR